MSDFYISYKIKAKIEGHNTVEIIAAILVGIVALEHLFIMILEMFFMNSKVAKRAFQLPEHLEGDRNVALCLQTKVYIMDF